jgi:acetyl esterase/lipase
VAYWKAPVWLLDRADRLVGGDQGTAEVADGLSFGTLPRQKLDIWAPKAKTTQKLPVLVFLYGGGWHWGERGEYGFAGRAFASKGFIVVVPDYRLYPAVRFPAFIEDSAAAIKWVQTNISRFGGDPDRIAVAGHSAGAYNSLMVALDPQWLGDKPVKAVISLSGPADFFPFTSESSVNAMGNAPDPLQTQPVTFVRRDAPPILLMHGTADTVVRVRNSISLEAKQKASGGKISLRTLDGASHNDVVMALSVLDESARFLQDQMKEESEHADQGRRISDPPNR